MKNFIWRIKNFGLKIALDDMVISFTKWFLGAKRIKIIYFPKCEHHRRECTGTSESFVDWRCLDCGKNLRERKPKNYGPRFI